MVILSRREGLRDGEDNEDIEDDDDDEASRLTRSCQAASARGVTTVGARTGRRLRLLMGEAGERAKQPVRGTSVVRIGATSVTTTAVDQAIAWRALKSMADNGRAVLIIGSPGGKKATVAKSDAALRKQRENGYRGRSAFSFLTRVYENFNVTEHFSVPSASVRGPGVSCREGPAGRGQMAQDLRFPVALDSLGAGGCPPGGGGLEAEAGA